MSLLTTVNSGGGPGVSASGLPVDYFIKNIGGNGDTAADAPCIKGTTLGAVRIGNTAAGLILRGDTVAAANRIAGGQTSGGSLQIGNSTTSFQNIILSDGATSVSTDLAVGIVGAPTMGNIVLTNGITNGKSISGYWNATTPSASYPTGADTPIANPSGLTAGWYVIGVACAPGSQAEEQTSTMAHWSGTLWDIGGAIQSIAGAGSFGLKPTDDRTAMRVHNATGAAQVATVYWAKMLN